MTERRTMGEMLSEVADGAIGAASVAGLRATRVEVTLPIDVSFRGSGDQLQLLAELPRFITRCAFDSQPGSLTVVWQEAAP